MLPSIRITLVLILLCIAKPALALSYSGLPFSATVVDADTKEPIEGVIVVAAWRLEFRNGNTGGFLTSTEAVTDKNGFFKMPGWGPLDVGIYEGRIPRMGPNEPGLLLFKPGYEPGDVSGTQETYHLKDPMWNGDPVRAVSLDGRAIELRRWTKSDAIYNQTLMLWRSGVPLVGGCGWTRAPRMTIALIREGERLKYLTGRNDIFHPDDLHEDYEGQHCGSKKPILDEALK